METLLEFGLEMLVAVLTPSFRGNTGLVLAGLFTMIAVGGILFTVIVG